ncbi:unnamed protein product [Lactuca virosa]|uniref:RRM domain-containing protein n=1 Tax=Lactuca virosa TaxID=75947 RepID=A0AAU9M287_9ASTR|nr:unnamed protein product [Lactuca virosa]
MQSGNDGGSDQQQQTQKTQPAVPTTTTGAAAGMGVGVGLGQQQWVAMQYPAAAMLMQHQMMAPSPANYQVTPHYMPYHPHHLHHQPHTPVVQQPQQGSGGGDNKAIWVGDLHSWMDEDYLRNCFASTGEVTSIKVVRNKQTGDLAADVTDALLHETFANKYPSVKAAKVVIDINTGRSKGYGFVRFGDDNERTQAMTEMNGTYCSTRPMRIGAATPRKSSAFQQGGYMSNGGSQNDGDSTNTTIFVGGLDPTVSDEDLRQPFTEYGEILSVKIPVGKGCGFVQFANRNNAEEALQKLNGTAIGKQTVRLSWGRNPANKQLRNDFGNQWPATACYGGQIYDGYGYALQAPHDPSMYAAAYGSYAMYGTHQQQVS